MKSANKHILFISIILFSLVSCNKNNDSETNQQLEIQFVDIENNSLCTAYVHENINFRFIVKTPKGINTIQRKINIKDETSIDTIYNVQDSTLTDKLETLLWLESEYKVTDSFNNVQLEWIVTDNSNELAYANTTVVPEIFKSSINYPFLLVDLSDVNSVDVVYNDSPEYDRFKTQNNPPSQRFTTSTNLEHNLFSVRTPVWVNIERTGENNNTNELHLENALSFEESEGIGKALKTLDYKGKVAAKYAITLWSNDKNPLTGDYSFSAFLPEDVSIELELGMRKIKADIYVDAEQDTGLQDGFGTRTTDYDVVIQLCNRSSFEVFAGNQNSGVYSSFVATISAANQWETLTFEELEKYTPNNKRWCYDTSLKDKVNMIAIYPGIDYEDNINHTLAPYYIKNIRIE